MKKLLVIGVALLLVLGLTAVAGADFWYSASSYVDNGTLNKTYNLNGPGGNIFKDQTLMSGQKLSLDTFANQWADGPDLGPGALFMYNATAQTGDRSVVPGYQTITKFTRTQRPVTLNPQHVQSFTAWAWAGGGYEPDKLFVDTYVELGDFVSGVVFTDPITTTPLLPEYGIVQTTHAWGDQAQISGSQTLTVGLLTTVIPIYAYTAPGYAENDYSYIVDPW